MSYQQKISEQENIDRNICIKMVKQLLSDGYVVDDVQELPITCPIDLLFSIREKSTGKVYNTFVEVKSRNKNERQLTEYPWAELKMERLHKMRNYQLKFPDSCLFYAVILNGTDFYLYNLLSIDYKKIDFVDWEVKKTQFDPNSYKETYKIAQLPFSLAKHANIIQTSEEKKDTSLF